MEQKNTEVIAFAGSQRIAAGALPEVGVQVKRFTNANPALSVLVFEAHTSRVVDLDLRGSEAEVRARLARPTAEGTPAAAVESTSRSSTERGRGRPRMGVVGREVTLLPRHWDWLAEQPGGASAALRRLVERARREGKREEEIRRGQESTYRFMAAMAGNEPGFEDASRALFAGNSAALATATSRWPEDVREHARALARAAFETFVEGEGE